MPSVEPDEPFSNIDDLTDSTADCIYRKEYRESGMLQQVVNNVGSRARKI